MECLKLQHLRERSVFKVLMSLSTIIVALNAQLLRRLNLSTQLA
ncbi:MAG: hypothetical protein ABI700_01350 [Chloroflexota bacterium]